MAKKNKIDFENSKKLYYSIKEVASHFDVNESLLRFWESEFKEINPRKTDGGNRQYTKEDIEKVQLIYSLVKERGMTLEGARQVLATKKDEETRKLEVLKRLNELKKELIDMRNALDSI